MLLSNFVIYNLQNPSPLLSWKQLHISNKKAYLYAERKWKGTVITIFSFCYFIVVCLGLPSFHYELSEITVQASNLCGFE
jgi:hypothetical protein